jgi:hypothetical protein
MENKIESATEIQEETGNYLQLFLYRVPKKNHDAIVKNLKQFVPWFKKHGARVEYYQLGRSETKAALDSAKQSGMDVMDSIDKALSSAAADDEEEKEEVWIEQQKTAFNGSSRLSFKRAANILFFDTLTGLRPTEAIKSIHMIHTELDNYLNRERMVLEHFRYRDIFIRPTKNAFISVLTPQLLELAKRLQRTAAGLPFIIC